MSYKILRVLSTKTTIFYNLRTLQKNQSPGLFHLQRFSAVASPQINNKHNLKQEPVSDKEYFVTLQNDPDTFGQTAIVEEEIEDEGDLKEQKHLEEKPLKRQKLTTKQYADLIKSHLRKRKIKEAIDVLEIRMLKDDRVKPENYIYNLLLGACGRVGYTKKAFSLYNKMKQRGLKPMAGTYTALFNACANSPWLDDGLSRATKLRQQLIEKMYEPNDSNYNAMIKAFGRCGDLKTAFALVDEMISKRMPLGSDNLNFLLQSCVSDKEAGFRHALLVWRRFLRKKIKPDLFSYNLLLRCVRDCGLGDIEATNKALDMIFDKSYAIAGSKKEKENKMIGDGNVNMESDLVEIKDESVDLRPNLLANVPTMGSVITISEIIKPEDRLLLLGGMKGFLEDMEEKECKPNIKTITQLMDCIPNTLPAEKELILVLEKSSVKADIDFYNMLIKRRCLRNDFNGAREALNMLKSKKMRPDLITYGVMALSCKSREDARNLIEEMQAAKYRLNIEILGALLYKACGAFNFKYVIDVMELCIHEEVQPSPKFMDRLMDFKKKCKDISNDKHNPLSHKTTFKEGFKIFRVRLKTWLQEVKVDDVEEDHPWQQYRQTNENEANHYKDKVTHFKPRHNTFFRQKTKLVQK